MRTLLKRSAEAVLCRSGAPWVGRALRPGRTLVLAYHNVVPDGEAGTGDRSLHLPQREFARQLDLIARTHDVVPLASLARPSDAARKPRVVITFDDAYRGSVTAGVAELARRGMPATIFVAPAFVDGGTFWWDVLSHPESGLAPQLRTHALGALRGMDADIRAWAGRQGIATSPVAPHQAGASVAELAGAVATGLVTLGAHSWHHPNLAALSRRELDYELTRPLEWLRARFAAVVPWVSYPYGICSPQVEAAAQRAGYQGAFLVEGGWLPRGGLSAPGYALPRANVPAGASLRRFQLITSGVTPR